MRTTILIACLILAGCANMPPEQRFNARMIGATVGGFILAGYVIQEPDADLPAD